ncbi:MAG: hypothetical protein H8E44_32920 [Planctomycetes bacterium]|nr:hypothetical protein [Planctomycetota bacterium]MBL7041950.1 hypothetical protein [Pirellulaceae bacterium]
MSPTKPGPAFDKVDQPLFSPDGSRVAYRGVKGDTCVVVVDGQPSPEYDRSYENIFFSSDSKRVAYIAKRGEKKLVVVDGEPSLEYDDVGSPVFSQDGLHVAYRARKGDKEWVILDGQAVAEHEGIGAKSPILSQLGNYLAYGVRNGKKVHVVVGETPGPEYDGIAQGSSFFGPDRFVPSEITLVPMGPGGMPDFGRARADGTTYRSTTDCDPTFRPDGVLEYLAHRDGMLYRVKHLPVIQAERMEQCTKLPAAGSTSEAKGPETNTTSQTPESSKGQYVLVGVKCVVYHSGYEGIIVAPGVLKPTGGTVVSLECNGKKVDILDEAIADGFIETKEFGKIGVRFGSMVTTVGAGDFTSVGEGTSVPEQAIEVYVEESEQKNFMDLFAKNPQPTEETETFNGKVKAVTLTTAAGPGSLFDTTIDMSKRDPASTVNITLEGRPEMEFLIPVLHVVEQKDFADLNGRHEAMGGLLILTDLQKRLNGKQILFKCQKVRQEGSKRTYRIDHFEISQDQTAPGATESEARQAHLGKLMDIVRSEREQVRKKALAIRELGKMSSELGPHTAGVISLLIPMVKEDAQIVAIWSSLTIEALENDEATVSGSFFNTTIANEAVDALRALTGQKFIDTSVIQGKMYDEAHDEWEKWWKSNKGEFLRTRDNSR